MSDEENQTNTEAPQNDFRHLTVDYCPRCGVPTCYCQFFGHKRPQPKEDGEGNGEEPQEEEFEETKPKKGGAKKGNEEKPNIIVTVKQRTKRKNTTTIANLEQWDIDTKEFSKLISKKMAIGCSSKKSQTGLQIVIQGDAGEQVINLLCKEFKVPKKNISAVRKVKKAPEPKQPAAQPVFDELPGSSDDGDNNDNSDDEGENGNNEDDDEFENPNRPSKKQKQNQQQNQQNQNQQQQQQNENDQQNHNRGRGGGGNRGGRGGGRGGNRGGNRGGRGRGRGHK
ncbi:hypothetical protein TRFO_35550 [Tritrichomonas foetus]|uniref:SUI1 domain-containing protein n=1 Tax=Tritrichomonas foetus TaxID=1144522 RepID=A0A1J4JIC7_9EUKA|nr:hypothetical protein TRFO_35550 [Tritrichomonas foetus]|eukprot:OHS98087.1 hypothetical protein TRFO_35550 [Tritrichomonas foetus]